MIIVLSGSSRPDSFGEEEVASYHLRQLPSCIRSYWGENIGDERTRDGVGWRKRHTCRVRDSNGANNLFGCR